MAAVAVSGCFGRSKAARKSGRRRVIRASAPGWSTFAAAHELHGQAELTFAPEGLRAEIVFPLA